jgi:hypothetical protein
MVAHQLDRRDLCGGKDHITRDTEQIADARRAAFQ